MNKKFGLAGQSDLKINTNSRLVGQSGLKINTNIKRLLDWQVSLSPDLKMNTNSELAGQFDLKINQTLDRLKHDFEFWYRVFIEYCVFFEDSKIYSGLWPLSVSPRCQCVYTMAGQTPALQQNLKS